MVVIATIMTIIWKPGYGIVSLFLFLKHKIQKISLIIQGRSGQNVDQILSQKTPQKMRFLSIFLETWKF